MQAVIVHLLVAMGNGGSHRNALSAEQTRIAHMYEVAPLFRSAAPTYLRQTERRIAFSAPAILRSKVSDLSPALVQTLRVATDLRFAEARRHVQLGRSAPRTRTVDLILCSGNILPLAGKVFCRKLVDGNNKKSTSDEYFYFVRKFFEDFTEGPHGLSPSWRTSHV